LYLYLYFFFKLGRFMSTYTKFNFGRQSCINVQKTDINLFVYNIILIWKFWQAPTIHVYLAQKAVILIVMNQYQHLLQQTSLMLRLKLLPEWILLVLLTLILPDPNKFPFLLSLGYNWMSMDCLIQEILFFHGNNQITFMHGNNRKGSLVIIPSHRHLECYEVELLKKSALVTIIDTSEHCRSSQEEAAECPLRSLFWNMKSHLFQLPMTSVS